MSYLTVTSLDYAKNILRIDDTLTEDDARITNIINAAWSFIERWTNVLVYDRDKDYRVVNGCVRVYDYPINEDISAMETTKRTLYTLFNVDDEELTLNVGYDDPLKVPADLKMVADEIIDLMYYEYETGKKLNKDLSSLSIDILNRNKRFFL